MKEKINIEDLSVVLATDCGSTTTKAVLFEKTKEGWRQTYRGEAPTTVEKPVADVTIGAINAFLEVQELSGRKILKDDFSENELPFIFKEKTGDTQGIDLYISTSSAGGGLQIIVAGVVKTMTTESAERAALGAGAIVLDAISIDDGRENHERVKRIRHLRPDIILIAGGTEGGTKNHPLELAEIILQADPRPRFGDTLKLPIIYAANSEVKDDAEKILAERFSFHAVENLRPSLEKENLAPAREAIHELFLHHVMSHAPGYKKLLSWSPVPIIPTPAAVGEMVLSAAQNTKQEILAVDIGGATTDVFSVFFSESDQEKREPIFNRTVSANLGMSYSVANVMLEAGEKNIARWLPFELSEEELRDRLRNKMIRPTSIPQTMQDLVLEQAVAREALRLAFEHHKRLAVGLKGVKKQRGIGDIFKQEADSLVDLFKLNLIIGSGGVLSHAPDRNSAALMLIDSYQPLGMTKLAVDSIFMMPHLGVFSTVHSQAASEIFFKDCLVPLGSVVAANCKLAQGLKVCSIKFEDGREKILYSGEIYKEKLDIGQEMTVNVKPLHSSVDFGLGAGKEVEFKLTGGCVGVIFDGRGRPVNFKSKELVQTWYQQMGISYE